MATKKTTTEKKSAGAKPRAPRQKKAATEAKVAPKVAAQAKAKKAAAPKSPKPAAEAKAQKATAPARPTHEQIAARAAEIWREKGGTHFDNWIQAERELSR